MNYELRVIWWLRCAAYSKSPFGVMNYELRVMSYELRVTSYLVAEVRSILEVTIWSYELFALALILTLIFTIFDSPRAAVVLH